MQQKTMNKYNNGKLKLDLEDKTMANTKTTTEINTNLICLVQQNYAEKKRAREEAKALEIRNRKAERYSAKVERKRNIKLNICKGIAVVCVSVVTFTTCMVAFAKSESRYAISRDQGNGIHYTYVTERECVVTKVTDAQVYVAYKGNEYSFYAYETELEVNDEIVCQFTDAMEIVGVVE